MKQNGMADAALTGCLGLTMLATACSHHSIDRRASAFLEPRKLELQNKQYRHAYVGALFAMVVLMGLTQSSSADLAFCTTICLVLLLPKIFTNEDHARRCWINYVALHVGGRRVPFIAVRRAAI